MTPWGWPWQPVPWGVAPLPGGLAVRLGSWLTQPQMVAASAYITACFGGGRDAVSGEEVGAGAREGTELKISLAALALLRQAPGSRQGKGSGDRALSSQPRPRSLRRSSASLCQRRSPPQYRNHPHSLKLFYFIIFFPVFPHLGATREWFCPVPGLHQATQSPPAAFIPTALLLPHLPTSTKARDCTRKLMFISLKGMFGVTFDLCRSLPLLPSLQLQRKHSNDPLFLFWNFILMLWRFAK